MKSVRIVNNFKSEWLKLTAQDESITIDETAGFYDNDGKLTALSNRISGQVVNVVESHGDYFEAIDDNFVIPVSLMRDAQ